jgi:hypothetical protein
MEPEQWLEVREGSSANLKLMASIWTTVSERKRWDMRNWLLKRMVLWYFQNKKENHALAKQYKLL